MQLTPYIIFNGTCEEALNFYAMALNGEIKNLSHFEDAPEEIANADKKQVLHAHFAANGIFFMASDSGQSNAEAAKGGMVHLSISFDNTKEQEKAFHALSEGANITMPLQDTFWVARFGMLTDKFGIQWMFNYDKAPTSEGK